MATETKNPAPSTATKKAEFENPKKTLTHTLPEFLDPASQNPATLVSSAPTQEKQNPASGGNDQTTNGGGSKAKEAQRATNGATGPVNDIEKKHRRAERFGVPIQLSEQEKRNSRAERFGTVSGSDSSKSSEELKRKARAERFGLTANSAVDEDAKKKTRIARFGSNTKTDPEEEDKRKARALRFAQSPADSLSHANGKGNIEMKNAVTGNTMGAT